MDNVLGIEDLIQENSIQIFPNPATNRITVSSEVETISAIEIYNVVGSKVWSNERVNRNSLQIDISNLKSGVYLLRTVNVNDVETIKKIIKL